MNEILTMAGMYDESTDSNYVDYEMLATVWYELELSR